MANDPNTCDHQHWTVDSAVNRTLLGNGTLGAVHLSVKLTCTDCGAGFWFPGMPTGVSYLGPTTSTDGFTASLVAVQANRRSSPDATLPTVTVNTGDILKGNRR